MSDGNPKGPSMFQDAPMPTEQIKGHQSGDFVTKSQDPSTGPAAYALGVARIVRVDYATHQVQIQIILGEKDYFDWAPIPASCPAAGNRHFIGALPEPGDICVIGWLATESKHPIILTYLPTAVGSGHEWLPLQDFEPTEVDINPQTQAHYEGIYGRYRHKMRAMRPGQIVLSSSQGSDIVLDEGVLITNRRATEVRLRDQDQAIVMRSLQQFHVMGGVRVYAGMVQRDAQFLPARMFSDGVNWDAGVQVDASGDPLTEAELGVSEEREGAFTPHRVFLRSNTTLPFADSGIRVESNVDPYSFLARGMFIGPGGFVLDSSKAISEAEYGGKPFWRVAIDPNPENTTLPSNSAVALDNTEADTLTEYRIQLTHSWDGTLPVSEQTDGFDADSLPSDSSQDTAMSSGSPYLQWVLGSVVGNDAYTERGSLLYGLPLAPQVFSESRVDPRMDSALGRPLGEHAASLFQVQSPIADPATIPPMFLSTTKDGRVKGFISGPQNENSIELALNGGMRIQSNGPVVLDVPNIAFNFRNGDPDNNYAAAFTSDTGAMLIRGNAPTTKGTFSARSGNTDIQESTFPSVLIESPSGNTHIVSGRFTKITGTNGIQLVDTNEVLLAAKQSINVFADKKLLQCNTHDKTVQGKETTLYSGPKNFLPTNAPIRSTTFIANPLTGHAGGTTDKYRLLFGDRDERILIGNHRTTVFVGNLTYQTRIGQVTQRAGFNQTIHNTVSGISSFSTSTISSFALVSASMTGLATATVRSFGLTRVSGLVTKLGGIGKVGRIISSADRDPLTNFRYSYYGMGSFGHRLGLPL